MRIGSFGYASILLLTGCTMLPPGPSVMVLPGSSKTFSQFTGDDVQCRQFALFQANGHSPVEAAALAGIGSAALGTAIGAAVGAAVGGGSGAAVGAGVGLATGSAVGAGVGTSVGYSAQERYDAAYIQCMYAQGHKVPVYGNMQALEPGQTNAALPPHGSSGRAMSLPPAPLNR
ncbi:MAG: hypothetical protein LUO80_03315 [Methylococcaceae bacterium]|jgi:outer membrane lipoprotein SlyB|nr:hypothetical protein [Methylococcaceae bacterium]